MRVFFGRNRNKLMHSHSSSIHLCITITFSAQCCDGSSRTQQHGYTTHFHQYPHAHRHSQRIGGTPDQNILLNTKAFRYRLRLPQILLRLDQNLKTHSPDAKQPTVALKKRKLPIHGNRSSRKRETSNSFELLDCQLSYVMDSLDSTRLAKTQTFDLTIGTVYAMPWTTLDAQSTLLACHPLLGSSNVQSDSRSILSVVCPTAPRSTLLVTPWEVLTVAT